VSVQLPARGSTFDAAVLKRKSQHALLQVLGTNERLWLRNRDLWHVMPGHVVHVKVDRRLRCPVHVPCVQGHILDVRVDPAALGLPPLQVELRVANNLGERAFEMERIWPGAHHGDDPIQEAVGLSRDGECAKAKQLLMDVLADDLRCLDAHAHLGNIEFLVYPQHAWLHYAIGVAIGDHALGPGFSGELPWRYTGNRPFLRSVFGLGLSWWRLERDQEARAAFERLMSLDPMDELNAMPCWRDVRRGYAWDESGGR